MSLRQVWYSFLAAIGIATVLLGSIWFYLHRQDADIQTVAVHVAVDSLPFLAAIIFALWPEVSKVHIGWRVTILVIGLLWTGLLARKDYLDLQASKKDLGTAVSTAVADANKHTDQQIQDVKAQVKDVASGLNERLKEVGKEVSKSDSDITGAIGKVIVPEPKYAQIKFSLFPATDITTPILDQVLPTDASGTISVDFVATNISDMSATSLDLWVEICKGCTYAQEPDKFENVNSTISTVRHRTFGNLNPGVSTDKMTVQIKSPTDAPFAPFNVGFLYSCQSCGKRGPEQVATIRPQHSAAAQ